MLDKINKKSKPIVKTTYQRTISIGDESETSAESKAGYRLQANKTRYLRHFPNIDDEEILKRYPCALVSDFLLQGYLYVTQNFLAFHSNIFGYVTKLLIPLRSIEEVTKEKTAKIIPNAIGITTPEGRHIFASFLSRDRTYAFLIKIWQQARDEDYFYDGSTSDYSESSTSSSALEEEIDVSKIHEQVLPSFKKNKEKQIFNTKVYYYPAIIFILFLFLSSFIMLHKIINVDKKYLENVERETIQDFFRRESDLKPLDKIIFKKKNQLSNVRKSLETLYSLLYLNNYGDTQDYHPKLKVE